MNARLFSFLIGSIVLVGLGLTMAAGCSIMLPGSKADFEYKRPPLMTTAAFDLGCPADRLSFTPVGSESDGYDKVGVSGCSKKATYTSLSDAGRVVWLKSSETDSTN